MRIEVIDSLSRAHELALAWDDLLARAADPSPFVSYPWLISWWEAYAGGSRMCLMAVWEGETLEGLAPLRLTEERIYGRRRRVLRFWYNPQAERINLLVSRERGREVLAALSAGLTDRLPRWDVARLGLVVRDQPTTGRFLEALNDAPVPVAVMDGHRSPYLLLPADAAELTAGLSASARQTLARKLKRAERADFTVEVDRSAARLTDAFDISGETWQHGRGTGIGSTAANRTFYEGVARRSAERGWLELAFLHYAGRPIAFEYNLIFGDTAFNLKLGYREDAREYSPGIVLKYRVLEHLIARGIACYDFMGEEEPYKLQWTDRVRQLSEIVAFGRGADLALIHALRFRAWPAVKDRLPWVVAARRRVAGWFRKE